MPACVESYVIYVRAEALIPNPSKTRAPWATYLHLFAAKLANVMTRPLHDKVADLIAEEGLVMQQEKHRTERVKALVATLVACLL